jgi:hypothetical protein
VLPESPPELRSAAAVQRELEGVYFDTLYLPNSPQRSRALGSLLALAFEAQREGELQERLAELERANPRGAARPLPRPGVAA